MGNVTQESWNPVWEDIFASNAWGKYPETELVRFIARNFYQTIDRKSIKILDLGCGPGANLWYIAREGFSVSGIDGSKTAIKKLRERLSSEGIHADLHIGDIKELQFSDNTFDAVIDCECLYCNTMEFSRKILTDIHRVLKPGGKFYSQTFAPETWGCEKIVNIPGHFGCAVEEGPLLGKGGVRITTESDIDFLYGGLFDVVSIDFLSRSVNSGKNVIKEWIILCTKR